jgi:hypothetical protein
VSNQVLPTFADRLAITLWYYDQSERAEAVLRARQDGTASKVATATTQSQLLAKVRHLGLLYCMCWHCVSRGAECYVEDFQPCSTVIHTHYGRFGVKSEIMYRSL